jgi:ornithine decarboxylase
VYGMDSNKINDLIFEIKDNNKINKLGIHIHRKSQNTSEWAIKEELQDSLSKETLERINLINIGGGLPVNYKNYTAEVLDYIFSKITKLNNWLKEKNIELIIEPGRFIAGPSTKLVSEIIAIHDNDIIIDSSVYQGNTDAIFQDSLKLIIEGELGERDEGREYLIKGKTPCSLDIFRYKVKLPMDLKVGDNIVFINAGAYNFSTNFCDLKRIETEIVE